MAINQTGSLSQSHNDLVK